MALRLSAGVAVLFMILTWIFPRPIMSIYTSEEEVIVQGIRYLKITAFIFVIHGTSLVAAQLMRSVGQAHLGLIVSIISFVVNIGANYIFIFGKFGMPRMEIAGAALGTLIARGAEFITTFLYILVKDKSLGLRICHLIKSPSAAFYRSYFRLGAPVLVSDSLLGLGGNIVSVVLGHMGAAVVASNAICQVVDRLCTVVIQGVSNASGIITGQTLGTGNRKKAMEQGETFYFFSIVFGLLSSLLVFLFGPLTVSVYTLNQETVVLVHQMMNAYVVIVFFQAIQSVMTKGVLRGGGDTNFLKGKGKERLLQQQEPFFVRSSIIRRHKLCHPSGKFCQVLGLEKHPPGAGELCEEQSLAAEKDISKSFYGFDLIADAAVKGHHIAGIELQDLAGSQLLFHQVAVHL